MKKKILISVACTLLLTMCLAVFAACKKSGDKVVITVGMWPEASQKADIEVFNKWKASFEADYPEYEIKPAAYTYSPDTVTAKAESGQLPTVFQTYFTEPQKLITSKYIADITDLLHEFGWYDKMDTTMREAVTSDGRVYGIPRDGYGLGLFLNLEMFYELGEIDKGADGKYILYDNDGAPLYPTTFADVKRVSELVVAEYENTYGMVILSANKNGGWQFSNMAWNFGASALQVNDGGKWKSALNSKGAVDALNWILDMRQNDLISSASSNSYMDWYRNIGSKTVAMAIAGSDALSLPVTNYNFNKDDIAFVPMPTGDGVSQNALYGGTPYVFSSKASKEQIKGAMLFLKYMGRSPEVDEVSTRAMEDGNRLAQSKGMPILPTIKPWVNEEYLTYANALEAQFVNVNMDYYKDFFSTIGTIKKAEEPYYCQEMYGYLDNAIQEVLSHPATANPQALLTTANGQFQTVLDKLK
ncbi:MAG: hypothetical protein LBN25_01360 [Christensenellaceae bacterium]|jgi:ABC-type glycerol-3-phosphate transport system substrate-binding protein|nr:hypothetical protein [Christensenellaceae bacterium]